MHVVCVGLATLDAIHALPRYPAADDRVVATELATAGGGPAATASVTLARLGVDAFFVGVVGDDDAGLELRAGLEREGVDVSGLAVVAGAQSPRSTVLVSGGDRAIVHYPGTVPPVELDARARRLCADAAWTHVDHVGFGPVRGLTRDSALRLSVDGGNPIDDLDLAGVALYAPTESELLARFGSPRGALDAGAELVVVTRGGDGSAAYTRDGVVEAPGVEVDAVSTLGAGDVFHGALLAALVRETPLADARTANVAAALSCRALDGRSAIPTIDELERSAPWPIASR
jgi:sugar/nucleoside kinase (ribokinase family)